MFEGEPQDSLNGMGPTCLTHPTDDRRLTHSDADVFRCVRCQQAVFCAAAMTKCPGCGETEDDGAIFESADGRCFRCNRPPAGNAEAAGNAASGPLTVDSIAKMKLPELKQARPADRSPTMLRCGIECFSLCRRSAIADSQKREQSRSLWTD
jgi:hypothetical protein